MTADIPEDPAIPHALYTVPEVMRILKFSKGTVYHLMQSGRLRSVQEGGSRRVTPGAIADYVALLEREALGQQEAAAA
jgi:excisionase family DNA binding protein